MYLNLANLRLLHFLRVTGSVLFLQSQVTTMMPFLIIIIILFEYLSTLFMTFFSIYFLFSISLLSIH